MTTELDPEVRASVAKLTKDLREASRTLSDQEARFLVDTYYEVQEMRKRASNQARAVSGAGEPIELLQWLDDQTRLLELQMKITLDAFSEAHAIGGWMRAQKGIGPVIAAGLLAHLDIEKAPTAGHFFSFAGLNPNREWHGAKRATEIVGDTMADHFPGHRGPLGEGHIQTIAQKAGFNPSFVHAMLRDPKTGEEKSPTGTNVAAALAKRPWNAKLKTLCWKVGESFVKVSNSPEWNYGWLYKERKAEEKIKNQAGEFVEQAKRELERKNYGRSTEAFGWYSGKKGGKPMLPPNHIHSRAKRFAVKIFLSNLHEVWFEKHHGKPAPAPYPFSHLGHGHKIEPRR